MIYKNEDNVNILEFGTGDIEVANGVPTEGPGVCVVFTAQEPAPIGRISEQAKKTYGDKPTIRTDANTMLLFTDPNSIDVVIEHLKQAKKNMASTDLE